MFFSVMGKSNPLYCVRLAFVHSWAEGVVPIDRVLWGNYEASSCN